MRRHIGTAALVAFFALSAGAAERGAASNYSQKIHEKQGRIHNVHEQLGVKREQLGKAKVRVSNLQAQLADTNRGIAGASARLDVLRAQIHSNQRRLAWNKIQLDAAEATLHRHNQALNRRLVDAYERGELGYINVLLSATSFSDFVERWDDIRFLVNANQRAVRERREAQRSVAAVRSHLEGAEFELEQSEARARQVRSQLAALAEQRRSLVVQADEERRGIAAAVAQLEELSAAEEAQLQALIVARQREEEARRAAEREAARRAAQLAGQEAPPQTEPGAPGTLSWPASGPITSPFGLRTDPVSGQGVHMHTGIDIGAPMGATITAAAAGRIIMAGWYGGYGNAVIIDHGGQMSTLYGHCSQLFVADGQDVQRGQAIAAVGSTGHSTGPHLHFEVRVNGVAVDPTSRLR